MSLWVKICANTSLEDARIAADAGADAVGFVLAPSPRRVPREQVAAIIPQLPASVEKIGVFVDASFDEIAGTVEGTGLTGVQLHFEPPLDLTNQLRARFGAALRILHVVHFPTEAISLPGNPTLSSKRSENNESDFGGNVMLAFALPFLDPNVDAVLVDSYSLTSRGGTGRRYDWGLAAVTLFQTTEKRKVAAGGLTPENVAEAVAVLRPWGLDVVSGVEMTPGKKDAAKVREFIRNARAAESDQK